MTITITAFEQSPDGGKGLARDTRVRWALEEVGQPYEVLGVKRTWRGRHVRERRRAIRLDTRGSRLRAQIST